jgi:hypothetical protein
VLCVDFSPDATRAVTVSRDGTWCVWRLDVRYSLQEDPKLLLRTKIEASNFGLFGLEAVVRIRFASIVSIPDMCVVDSSRKAPSTST